MSSKNTDPETLTVRDGVYDKDTGWVKEIHRLGVLKFNDKNGSYSITHYGTGW